MLVLLVVVVEVDELSDDDALVHEVNDDNEAWRC